MHHTVANSIDLIKTLDHTDLRIRQQREDELHTFCMFGDIVHDLSLLAIGKFYLHKGPIETYTLSTSTGHHTLIVHIIQGVLDRRRATIQYKDFHIFNFSIFQFYNYFFASIA